MCNKRTPVNTALTKDSILSSYVIYSIIFFIIVCFHQNEPVSVYLHEVCIAWILASSGYVPSLLLPLGLPVIFSVSRQVDPVFENERCDDGIMAAAGEGRT